MAMKRLLIIDDEIDTLFLLQTILQKKGFEVDIASSGEFALQKAAEFNPDIILLDIKLDNNFDGREICYQLKTNLKTSKPRVYLCSAHHSLSTASKYAEDGFIHKPFIIRNLVETLNE